MAFNKVILMGNLTEEPQLKATPSGVSVVSFRIAVGRRHKSEGQPEADFITIVAWRSTAEFIGKHFGKGDSILVCGQLQQRTYKDKDGNSRSTVEVIADEVSFAGYKKPSDGGSAVPVAPQVQEVDGDFVEVGTGDDLPF
jgi:single-strand DNA-binding protein